MQIKTLGQLAQHVDGKVVGDPAIKIKNAATLAEAKEGDISFLSNPKYENQLQTTNASAVVVAKEVQTPAAMIIARDPYYAFRQIVVLLHGHRQHSQTGISQYASIAKSAKIGKDCHIQNFVTIEDNVTIGDRCVIYPGVFIGPDTKIGDDCILYPNAVIFENCKIGNRVIIQANATVGEDGFGFATHNGQHYKIPHIGTVTIEDDVEIGAGSGIERGTLDETIISKGTKIGDLVAIGHGTKVGPYSLLVAQVGIAGSTKLGHHCVLGGQVGVAGHIKIGDMVQVGAKSGVINSVSDGKILLGEPAMEINQARRVYAIFEQLPELRKSVRNIEKQLGKKSKENKS
jgi:UDP-3-O-[3-hydroxymyristoyl] glucosamine N-acyltransferase